MRVRDKEIPLSFDKILGEGVDVQTLPEGHAACPMCKGHKWEPWVYLDSHRLELGCCNCGYSCRLLFPLDVTLSPFRNQGRFTCKRHKDKGFILIKNMETVCIGCESCFTEVQIKLKTKSNLVLADG